MDARNYIDKLLEKKRTGGQIPRYDFIYEDAINDYSVPYQLTTKEFNDNIAQVLTDDGIYMITLIDTSYIGLFVGAVINTLEQTFSNVYVIAEEKAHQMPWDTFVVIAAMRDINLENLALEKSVAKLKLWILNNSEIETLKGKGRGVILTDDYAPVENLMAPVVRQSAISSLPTRYQEWAIKLENEGKLDESLEMYKEVIKLDPSKSIPAYYSIGQILASQGKWQKAIEAAKSAIEYNEKARVKHSMADMYFNIALASKKLGRNENTNEYLNKAIEAYQEDLAQEPNTAKTLRNLGKTFLELNRFNEATEYLRQAVDMEPLEIRNHLMLAEALSEQHLYDEATEVLNKAIISFSKARNENAVIELQRYLWSVEDKSKNTK
jgi:tetratricopeptide (TPR) repeat protein